MENKNNQQELKQKKALLMAGRRRYYAEDGKQSEFATLPGHIKRAIERESNFQLDSMTKSDSFAPLLDKEKSDELFNAHCEYYAHLGLEQQNINPHNKSNLFNRLVARDSDAISGHDITRGEDSYDRKSSRHATTIDREAANHNQQEQIQLMLQKIKIRTT